MKIKVCFFTSIIPALGRLTHGDQEFKASLSYISNSRIAWTPQDPVLKKVGGGGGGEKVNIPLIIWKNERNLMSSL